MGQDKTERPAIVGDGLGPPCITWLVPKPAALHRLYQLTPGLVSIPIGFLTTGEPWFQHVGLAFVLSNQVNNCESEYPRMSP